MIQEDIKEIKVYNDFVDTVNFSIEDGNLLLNKNKGTKQWVANFFNADKKGLYYSITDSEPLEYNPGDTVLTIGARKSMNDEVKYFDFILHTPIISETINKQLNKEVNMNELSVNKVKENPIKGTNEPETNDYFKQLEDIVDDYNRITEAENNKFHLYNYDGDNLFEADGYKLGKSIDYTDRLRRLFIFEHDGMLTTNGETFEVKAGEVFVGFWPRYYHQERGIKDYIITNKSDMFHDIYERFNMMEQIEKEIEKNQNKCKGSTISEDTTCNPC